jgi:hypothetical protein
VNNIPDAHLNFPLVHDAGRGLVGVSEFSHKFDVDLHFSQNLERVYYEGELNDPCDNKSFDTIRVEGYYKID